MKDKRQAGGFSGVRALPGRGARHSPQPGALFPRLLCQLEAGTSDTHFSPTSNVNDCDCDAGPGRG